MLEAVVLTSAFLCLVAWVRISAIGRPFRKRIVKCIVLAHAPLSRNLGNWFTVDAKSKGYLHYRSNAVCFLINLLTHKS